LSLQESMGDVEFKRFLHRARESRPQVPAWDSKSDNSEDWKHKSAMQEGYDLCITTLGLDVGLITK
jgi:hypothetical protein